MSWWFHLGNEIDARDVNDGAESYKDRVPRPSAVSLLEKVSSGSSRTRFTIGEICNDKTPHVWLLHVCKTARLVASERRTELGETSGSSDDTVSVRVMSTGMLLNCPSEIWPTIVEDTFSRWLHSQIIPCRIRSDVNSRTSSPST